MRACELQGNPKWLIKMATTKMGTSGRATIPIEIRHHLNLKAGDQIEFFIERDGKVRLLVRNLDVRTLKGILGPAPRRASLEDMDAAIRKRAVEQDKRSRGG